MKKLSLLLLLMLSQHVIPMEQGYPDDYIKQEYSKDARWKISLKARALHDFLTKNLDNVEEVPDEWKVTGITNELKKYKVNPAILLELKDLRSSSYHSFPDYLKKDNVKHIDLIFAKGFKKSKDDNTVTYSKRLTKDNWFIDTQNENHIEFIKVAHANANQNQTFSLVRNTAKTYKPGKREYSLIHLLLQCKRPNIVQQLLKEASEYEPILWDISTLKYYCDEGIKQLYDEYKTDWPEYRKQVGYALHNKLNEVKDILDDAAYRSKGIKGIIRGKDAAISISPVAFVAWLMRDRITKDITALKKAILNPSTSCIRVLLTRGRDSNNELQWFKDYPNFTIWSELEKYEGDNWRGKSRDVDVVRYVAASLAYLVNKKQWDAIVDMINGKLHIDAHITNLLSKKSYWPITGTILAGSNGCQNVLENMVGLGKTIAKTIMPSNKKAQLEDRKKKLSKNKKTELSCTIV